MPVVIIGGHEIDFPEPRPKPPKRLPVAYLDSGEHGSMVGVSMGCQCRACTIEHTREVLTAENWDAD